MAWTRMSEKVCKQLDHLRDAPLPKLNSLPKEAVKGIRRAAADVASASDGLARQLIAHNRHGAAVCG